MAPDIPGIDRDGEAYDCGRGVVFDSLQQNRTAMGQALTTLEGNGQLRQVLFQFQYQIGQVDAPNFLRFKLKPGDRP